MGFVNKPTGDFNEHQFNWSDEDASSAGLRKRAFHTKTKDEIANEGKPSLPARASSPYISPELKSGNQNQIRRANISTRGNVGKRDPLTKLKRHEGLRLCEANMVMLLNALDLDLFNENNPIIASKVEKESMSDKDLTSVYESIRDNYNKKDFDPTSTDFVDNNGQTYTHDFKTISESKSSPTFPTLTEFLQNNRISGRRAYYATILRKKGITIG